jgi:hypothetical protein
MEIVYNYPGTIRPSPQGAAEPKSLNVIGKCPVKASISYFKVTLIWDASHTGEHIRPIMR